MLETKVLLQVHMILFFENKRENSKSYNVWLILDIYLYIILCLERTFLKAANSFDEHFAKSFGLSPANTHIPTTSKASKSYGRSLRSSRSGTVYTMNNFPIL